MRVQIASDLHLEMWPMDSFTPLLESMRSDADVLVLAGDIVSWTEKNYSRSVEMLNEFALRWPHVIYVAGNHEAYGTSIERVFADPVFVAPNFHWLEASSVTIQ